MIDENSWPWEAQQVVRTLRAKVSKLQGKNALNKVTRFEVIDHTWAGTGRDLVRYGTEVEISYQDDGRTLKVFLKDKE